MALVSRQGVWHAGVDKALVVLVCEKLSSLARTAEQRGERLQLFNPSRRRNSDEFF